MRIMLFVLLIITSIVMFIVTEWKRIPEIEGY